MSQFAIAFQENISEGLIRKIKETYITLEGCQFLWLQFLLKKLYECLSFNMTNSPQYKYSKRSLEWYQPLHVSTSFDYTCSKKISEAYATRINNGIQAFSKNQIFVYIQITFPWKLVNISLLFGLGHNSDTFDKILNVYIGPKHHLAQVASKLLSCIFCIW